MDTYDITFAKHILVVGGVGPIDVSTPLYHVETLTSSRQATYQKVLHPWTQPNLVPMDQVAIGFAGLLSEELLSPSP